MIKIITITNIQLPPDYLILYRLKYVTPIILEAMINPIPVKIPVNNVFISICPITAMSRRIVSNSNCMIILPSILKTVIIVINSICDTITNTIANALYRDVFCVIAAIITSTLIIPQKIGNCRSIIIVISKKLE